MADGRVLVCALSFVFLFSYCHGTLSSVYPTVEGLHFDADIVLVGKVDLASLSYAQSVVARDGKDFIIATPLDQSIFVSGNVSVVSSHPLCMTTTEPTMVATETAVVVCNAAANARIRISTNPASPLVQRLPPPPSWRSCSVAELLQADLIRVNATVAPMPAAMVARGGFEVTAQRGVLLLAGGKTGENANEHRNDVWQSSDQGLSWTLVTSNGGYTPAANFAMCADSEMIYIAGGSTCNGQGLSNSVWNSSDGGRTWERLGNAWKRHAYHVGCGVMGPSEIVFHEGCISSSSDCRTACVREQGLAEWRPGSITHLNNRPYSITTRSMVQVTGNATRLVLSGGIEEPVGVNNVLLQRGDVWSSVVEGTQDTGRRWNEVAVPWNTTGLQQRVVSWEGYDLGYGEAGLWLRNPDSGDWRELKDQDGMSVTSYGHTVPADMWSFTRVAFPRSTVYTAECADA